MGVGVVLDVAWAVISGKLSELGETEIMESEVSHRITWTNHGTTPAIPAGEIKTLRDKANLSRQAFDTHAGTHLNGKVPADGDEVVDWDDLSELFREALYLQFKQMSVARAEDLRDLRG